METITDKITRWKMTAEVFLREDVPVFIKEVSEEFYFGHILLVGDDTLTIHCFNPTKKRGKRFTLYWALITDFDKYKEKEEQ